MSITSPPRTPIHPVQETPVEETRSLHFPLDPLLTLAVLGLGLCSLLTLRAATSHIVAGQPSYYVERQAVYLIVGVVAMGILSQVDYSQARQLQRGIYVLLLLSILAVLGAGHAARGSQRAIELPFFNFQASELGKVLLILSLAAFVVDRTRELRRAANTARVVGAALVPAVLVIAQPDLGSGLVYVVIALMLLFVAGAPWRHFAAIFALGAAVLALALIVAPAAGVHVLKPYQVERLTAFLHPSKDPKKEGYQQEESKIAIGSGQKTGRGANATQVPLNFVPESHTDFIFAAVGERYGFVGAALLLSLYALLIWRALRVLTMARDTYGALVAGGVVAMLMFQVFVNVGMAVGIMPITGVTLPLMSYGGSSVITTLLAVGLLQSIYVQARASAANRGRVLRY
ncbi:MAG TPA: rod shape-determining protein RodA [Solirubrobacteraceae bacterium]|jgi:rod shape determining protein RodA|nr:rod shape-determining protein RodA [Solirubrobacteraceae bacterium]